ncbi:MAG: hypothetical protein ACREQV_01655 [Candidatus Binatia bacterium]
MLLTVRRRDFSSAALRRLSWRVGDPILALVYTSTRTTWIAARLQRRTLRQFVANINRVNVSNFHDPALKLS